MLHQSITAAVQNASKRCEGTRARNSQNSQLLKVMETLLEVLHDLNLSPSRLDDVPAEVVQECVRRWQAAKLSPSTINSRLSVLSILGVKTNKCWVKNRLGPKWWLRPEEQDRLLTYLSVCPGTI